MVLKQTFEQWIRDCLTLLHVQYGNLEWSYEAVEETFSHHYAHGHSPDSAMLLELGPPCNAFINVEGG